MEEQLQGQEWYGGVEPTDVGSLDDVKEQRSILPPAKDVRVRIARAEIKDKLDEVSRRPIYRQLVLGLKLTEGIDGKFKGMFVNARVCFYADPAIYTKDFFKNKQHLVQLKYLSRSTGLDFNKIDGHTLVDLCNAPEIKITITQKPGLAKYINKSTGAYLRKEEANLLNPSEYDVEQEPENEAKNFKGLDPTELI